MCYVTVFSRIFLQNKEYFTYCIMSVHVLNHCYFHQKSQVLISQIKEMAVRKQCIEHAQSTQNSKNCHTTNSTILTATFQVHMSLQTVPQVSKKTYGVAGLVMPTAYVPKQQCQCKRNKDIIYQSYYMSKR